jgi:hypothetical protein
MELHSSHNGGYEIAKLWNILLGDSHLTNSSTSYFNLENYAFRMDILINNTKSEKNIDKNMTHALEKIKEVVVNSSNLKAYLSRERERFKIPVKSKKPTIEVLDLSNNISLNTKENPEKTANNDNLIKETNVADICVTKQVQIDQNNQSSLSDADINEIVISLLNLIKQHKRTELKDFVTEIAQKYSIEDIKRVCKMDFNLTENELGLLVEILTEINKSEIILSYNVSFAFLGILSDYVRVKMKSECQSGQGLSRQIFTISVSAYSKFSRQFILSCALNWIKLLNENLDEKQKIGNKLFTEFLAKLVKECFDEIASSLLLHHLAIENSNSTWSENVYILVSSLHDKISNLKLEFLKVIIEKMFNDSKEMSKSNVFSKLLLNIMNKFKNALSNQPQPKKIQENSTEMQLESEEHLNANTLGNNQLKKSTNLSNWLEQIFLIIENNQTILKRSLLNIANSFKTENLI